jgi:hypothetical protein
MARACELTVAAIRAAIVAWRKANLKPVSKMRVKELELEFDRFPDAQLFIPDDQTDTIRAPTARKIISAYRREHHPPLTKQGVWTRDTLISYMDEFNVTASSGTRLKHDKCQVTVDGEVTLNPRKRKPKKLSRSQMDADIARMRRKLDERNDEEIIAAEAELYEPVRGPRKKATAKPKRRVKPTPVAGLSKTKPRRKRRQPGDGLADYQAYVQGDEFAARAAQLDAADSSLAW